LINITSTATPRMRLNKLQQIAVTALEDIKARDIKVLDVRKLTTFCDSFIIASADSNRQANALAHHVRDALKDAGATIVGVEGEEWASGCCRLRRHRRARDAACGPRVPQPEELWKPPRPRAGPGPRDGRKEERPRKERPAPARFSENQVAGAPTGRGKSSRPFLSRKIELASFCEAAHHRARTSDARVGQGRI
jgi:ribosome-associated protein